MTDRLTVDTITSDQLDALYAERDEHKQSYLNACKTIAAMHAAAVGRDDEGPIRGVVEDVEDVRLRAERVRDLRDRWVKAGPPPLGVPIARWWDARLIELNAALAEPKKDA